MVEVNISGPIASTADAYKETKKAELENRRVRAIERETTKRKLIQASVDKTQIIEKYKWRRAKTFNELGYRYINESDQILNSLDRVMYSREWKKGNSTSKVNLSVLSSMFLLSVFAPMIGDKTNDHRWYDIAVQQRDSMNNVIDKMEFMARTASAGDLTYTLPEGWGETDNQAGASPNLPIDTEPPLSAEGERLTSNIIDLSKELINAEYNLEGLKRQLAKGKGGMFTEEYFATAEQAKKQEDAVRKLKSDIARHERLLTLEKG